MRRDGRARKVEENSVNTALSELMGLEDERQERERLEREAAAAEAEKRREAEEAERRRFEEEKRRREEEARIASERRRREEEARLEREAEERAYRLRVEADRALRDDEQRRLLEHERELQRMAAGAKRLPRWAAPVAAAVVIGAAGLWFGAYSAVRADAEARVNAVERDKNSAVMQMEREIVAARADAEKSRSTLEHERKVSTDRLRKLSEQCTANSGDRQIVIRGGATRPTGTRATGPRNGTGIEDLPFVGSGESRAGSSGSDPFGDDPMKGEVDLTQESERKKNR